MQVVNLNDAHFHYTINDTRIKQLTDVSVCALFLRQVFKVSFVDGSLHASEDIICPHMSCKRQNNTWPGK